MTDSTARAVIIAPEILAQARLKRSAARLSEVLRQKLALMMEIKSNLDIILILLESQRKTFQELIARNDDVEYFCDRCRVIMDCADPEQMVRERDWLIASFRKRNAHRQLWLDRLGISR